MTQGRQATPESSSLKIVYPSWRPSWVWCLAEAPALFAVACNSVPALTLLSGSTPPEKNPFEPLQRREGSVACIIQNELGKAATTWNQLLLLLLWYLIPKVVKPPPNIDHAGVEAVDGPRFNQNQRRVRSGEKSCLYSAPNLSYIRFWGAGKDGIKENNIIYITQLHTSEISCFVKFKA